MKKHGAFHTIDVVELMTELLFVGEEETYGSIKLVYDPACGTVECLLVVKNLLLKIILKWMLYYMIKK